MRVRSLFLRGAALATFPLAELLAQDTTRTAQKLGTVTVKDSADFISVRLAGFEHRRLRKQGTVSFFMGDDIRKRGTIRLSDALRRAPGVRIIDSQYLMGQKMVARREWSCLAVEGSPSAANLNGHLAVSRGSARIRLRTPICVPASCKLLSTVS